MKSIYASKLFKASKRQDQIKAAMVAQANLGLMQQLAEDLDDEFQTPENLGTDTSKPEEVTEETDEFDGLIVDEEIDPEKDLVTMDDLKSPKPSGSAPRISKSSGSSKNKAPEKPEMDTSDLIPESPANEKPEPESKLVEESTEVKSKENIKASITDKLNCFKDTLNSRQDTAGVIRIAQKEKEMWIYYNDDVNLNDIMVDVIECIANIDCNMFEFNRLARSDNAIVFVIGLETTTEPEQIDPEEAKKIAEEEVIEVADVK